LTVGLPPAAPSFFFGVPASGGLSSGVGGNCAVAGAIAAAAARTNAAAQT
jgi:hypothetical protein